MKDEMVVFKFSSKHLDADISNCTLLDFSNFTPTLLAILEIIFRTYTVNKDMSFNLLA